MSLTYGKTILIYALLAGVVGALIGLGGEVQQVKRKRMKPDDPSGTAVFMEALPKTVLEEVERLLQKHGHTNPPNPEVLAWIDKLASYELIEDHVSGMEGTIRESTVACIELKRLGVSALGPLIKATARPNTMIRSAVLGLVASIASANNIEMEILPVFLRSLHDAEKKGVAIGAISALCRSLATKKRYDDCEVCVGHIARMLNDKDERIVKIAAYELYEFDRVELIPEHIQVQVDLAGFIEKMKSSSIHTRRPLPRRGESALNLPNLESPAAPPK